MNVFKSIGIVLVLLGSGLAAFGQTITVTAPAGGERWELGSAVTITWTASDLGGDVRINLIAADGSVAGTICEAARARAGSQPWTVGTLVDGSAAAGENYRIRVRSIGTRILDDSEPFAIVAAGPGPEPATPELTLTAPNGGQVWYLDETQNITWRSRNLAGVEWVKLLLYQGGRDDAHFVGIISGSVAVGSGTGSLNWRPGVVLTRAEPLTGNNCFYIKVATLDNSRYDFSDTPFSINLRVRLQEPMQAVPFTAPAADGPAVEVPTPLAPLTISHLFTIRWAARGVTSDLVINLLTESGGTWTIATGVDPGLATGHFTWTVGRLAGGRHLITTAGERFRFQVGGRGAVGLTRWFEIITPTIRVTEPHRGQRIRRGDRITIRWDAPELQGDIKIEAQSKTLPSGWYSTYETLAAAAHNTGRRDWTVFPRLGGGELDPPPCGDNVRWRIVLRSVRVPEILATSEDFIIE